MPKLFNRRFPKAGLDALAMRPAWWQDVLEAWFKDESGPEQRPLFLAVRDNYLNAYVEGQSVYKIKFKTAAAPPDLRAAIHHKYVLDAAEGQKLLSFDGCRAGDVVYEGAPTLNRWIEQARGFAGPEKKGVAIIADANSNVIDVEMALPGHASRIDMVALERRGNAIRIVFYEAKCLENSALVSNTEPKALEQIEKYAEWLRPSSTQKLLADCYRRTCKILLALHDMQDRKRHRLISEAAEDDSNLVIDPEPRLVIFGYDPHGLRANWSTTHKPKLEKAGFRGARLIMSPSARGISLPDGSDNESWCDEATDIASSSESPKAFAEMQLTGLASFADRFSAPGFSFGQWSKSNQSTDGIIEPPTYQLSDEGRAFVKTVNGSGWMKDFPWPDWLETPEAKALFATSAGATRASEEDLWHMLTAVVRGDRFIEGTLGHAFDKGTLSAIVHRAGVLQWGPKA